MTIEQETRTTEHTDLLDALAEHRAFLCQAVGGLSDHQIALHPTASELCLGGIVKHVTRMEQRWAGFIVDGPAAMAMDPAAFEAHAASFRLVEGDTLAGLLDGYAEVAARTDALVAGLPSLDASHPLPEAPWFAPGARWSARRAIVHIIAETAQHAGHADIIRESIDGARTMG